MPGRWSKAAIAALTAVAVTALAAAPGQAAFPTGTNGKIAFSTTVPPARHLALINPDGSGVMPLTSTESPVADVSPAFSPTGLQVVFDRQDAAFQRDIYRVNADGSGLVDLTNTP